MSAAKPTPGPWVVAGRRGADGHLSVHQADDGRRGAFVARVHRRGEAITDEARANARLIAATPDLLKMLRRVTQELAALGKGRISVERLVDEACALGNKAEGRE